MDIEKDWAYFDPESSQRRFEALLEIALGDGNAERALIIKTQLARIQSELDNRPGGHAILDAIEEDVRQYPEAQIRWLLEKGRILKHDGFPLDAKPLYLRALGPAKTLGDDFLTADVLHELGIVSEMKDRHAYNLETLDFIEKSAQEKAKRWFSAMYHNLGTSSLDRREFAQAATYFEKAIALYDQEGILPAKRLAMWGLGFVSVRQGRYAEALLVFHALEETDEPIYKCTRERLTDVIRSCYEALGRTPPQK